MPVGRGPVVVGGDDEFGGAEAVDGVGAVFLLKSMYMDIQEALIDLQKLPWNSPI